MAGSREFATHGINSAEATVSTGSPRAMPQIESGPTKYAPLPEFNLFSPEMIMTRKQFAEQAGSRKLDIVENLLVFHMTAESDEQQGVVGAQIDRLVPFQMQHPISPFEREFFSDYEGYVQMNMKDRAAAKEYALNPGRIKTESLKELNRRLKLTAWFSRLTEEGKVSIIDEIKRRESGLPLNLNGTAGEVKKKGDEDGYKNIRKVRYELEQKARARIDAERLAQTEPANQMAA